MDGVIPREPCAMPNDAPAGTPDKEPASAEPGPRQRFSACGDFSDMTDDVGNIEPIPSAGPPTDPNPDPHFYDDISYKGLRTLRKQRALPNRDAMSLLITRPLARDQFDRKRAPDNSDAESSVAKKRSLMSIRHSAFVAGKELVSGAANSGARLRKMARGRDPARRQMGLTRPSRPGPRTYVARPCARYSRGKRTRNTAPRYGRLERANPRSVRNLMRFARVPNQLY